MSKNQYIAYSPLRIPTTARKFFILNLNNYRNLHYRTLAKAKRVYTEVMRDQVQCLPGFMTCTLTLTVYPKTRRKFDLDNVGSVHAKFFQDCLVKFNRIPDDDFKCITRVAIEYGSVDKFHPRVEILIEDTSNLITGKQNEEI